MKRRVFCKALAACLLAASASSSAGFQSEAFRLASPVTIPFELVIRHIVLRATIDDSRGLSFVLDTGAKGVIVDLARARELGLPLGAPVRAGGAGTQTTTGFFVQKGAFRVAGLEGFTRPVTLALPLDGLARRFGHDFDGIVGTDVMKEFVVEIDYEARVITLHDRIAFTYSGPGSSIPARLDAAGHPIVDVAITPAGQAAPIGARCVIDIGSGGSLVLHTPFVSAHRLPGEGVKTIKAIGVGGAGGAVAGRLGRVSALKIGTFTIAGPATLFAEDPAGAFASAAIQGNIGQQILSRFKVFLDLGRDRMILEPGATFGAPFDRATSGVSLDTGGPDYRTLSIVDVLEDSPAAEAGLRPGDVITSIDGRAASALTLTIVMDMLERAASYRLTIQRGGQTLPVTLTPRQLF